MQRDSTRPQKNPDRVPSTLTAIDGPQEGALRAITVLVGTPMTEDTMVTRSTVDNEYFEVPEDGTYMDDRGNPIALNKGDKLPLARAARFKDFNVSTEGTTLSGLTDARAMSAPENRMEPAPENRESTAKSKKA